MKLKTIASIFNRNKQLTIYTTESGEQWLSNGMAMYSLRGMPYMESETILRIFDVPPDKRSKWFCNESKMTSTVEYEDNTENETGMEPLNVKIEWLDDKYWFFQDGKKIYGFKEEYIKPLLDEPDYLTYHKRELDCGVFVLACKIGFEIKAIIFPCALHKEKKHTEEIEQIARLYKSMQLEQTANADYEFYGTNEQPGGVDPETGEILDGQESFGEELL
ncbi:hypothetical protein FACS1894111_05880 [Clostridia bacterium]|nr:hypothetical protein FACS1894111_05880 [Clostridia bacterium]